MKENDWLILAIAAVLAYLLWEHEKTRGQGLAVTVAAPPNGIPPAPGTGSASGPTTSLPSTATGLTGASKVAAQVTGTAEAAASAYTHVPLSTVGSLAERAPTWAKVALFPIGVTSVVQKVIDNPIGSVKGAATTIGHDVAHPIDTVTGAAKSVYGGAKSVVSGIGSALGSIF